MGQRKVTQEQERLILAELLLIRNDPGLLNRKEKVQIAFEKVFGAGNIPIKLSSSTVYRYWEKLPKNPVQPKMKREPSNLPLNQLKTMEAFSTMRRLKYCPFCGLNLDVIIAAMSMVEAQR